jgi:hypothetical protein
MQNFEFQPIASNTPSELDLTAGIGGDYGICPSGGNVLHLPIQDRLRHFTFRQTVTAGAPAALI